jgi:hypothetical protein
MLLTEHHQQYDSRENSPSQQPTSEEFILIRDYTLLPHILTIVQHNMDQLRHQKSVLKSAYQAVGEEVAKKITKDIYELRKELSKRNIRVENGEQDDIVLKYQYVCRGYNGTFDITREECRAQMGIKLGNYVSGLLSRLRDENKSKAPLN